jgi:hypothetical protein
MNSNYFIQNPKAPRKLCSSVPYGLPLTKDDPAGKHPTGQSRLGWSGIVPLL